jgi:UDP-2,3-diacylglucosamine hydrolase
MSAAPPFEWRPPLPASARIDFVSDLHLSAAMPRTFAAFTAYLQHTPADAVIILGDLFEAWVGDDARHDDWERSCVDALAAASRRTRLAFMAGNRDFLVGDAMLAAAGMQGLPDPTLMELHGTRCLLSHGDALCVDDLPYQQFRRVVRSPGWQAGFLCKPLAERRQIATAMRGASPVRGSLDGDMAIDVNAAEALRWLRAAGASVLVHGHTHRPGEHRLELGEPMAIERRVVLSDWDLDTTGTQRAEVLAWTAHGLRRLDPAAAALPR